MKHTTLTSKGQVTIPAEIREALHLQAGDRLVLTLAEDGFTASVERAPRVADVRGRFRHAARPGTSRAEERAAFEEAIAGKHAP
ncbi:AbrB/MazE/SpoVT family DNA-binding domain-containing protein [Deinococcus apachensis]|uniref:AbrB/MazE/SpoVT family DNA-binding domain-containing protein n=1 Tax=Deinococcus apachensis TaxID=309886 RepID=UPI000377B1E3|nr:AbrB/MazE/SpoVT family DNA-binding domain-containing protein [Deinococcus apachensis]